MDKSYIVSGCFFGDEGKGGAIDYLASLKNIKENVRYNGGSQASHTVVANDIKHKFSQLGSILLNEDTRNYLSEYTVVNPFNIYTESQIFSQKTNRKINDIIKNLFISSSSTIVTPYHKLLGQLKEISKKTQRRGSVGTGVSQTTKIYEELGLKITMQDLLNQDENLRNKLKELYKYTRNYLLENENNIDTKILKRIIDEKDIFYLTDLSNEEYILKCYENIVNAIEFNVIENITEFHKNGNILFEGSQGLLIDKNYGIRPNTTHLDTTNKNAIVLANKLNTKITKISVITPFTSRHGIGILPTFDKEINNKIFDVNQKTSYFQGTPKYGWFDLILARYSQSINQNDELFLTQIDRLSNFEKIKVCTNYIYYGEIDEDFNETFDYYKENNKVIITRLKKNNINLRKYLSKCLPQYIEFKGWKTNISTTKDPNELPNECIYLINYIEQQLNTPISYISIGENRSKKLERKIK